MSDRFVSSEPASARAEPNSATAVVDDGRFDLYSTIAPPEVAPHPPSQDAPDEPVPTERPGVGPSSIPTADEGPDRTPDRPSPPASLWRRFLRGRDSDPIWVRPALPALLLATAVLYLWGLGASGWANSFYSAAVQAGTKSWKAFFFGSFDASNFITVDKPPASLWVMDLSARLFGVNAWSILVPQALEGVAAVGILYATVRRWFGHAAGLLAGAVLALTPVAALMFRYDNPDALLVLLLTGGAYATDPRPRARADPVAGARRRPRRHRLHHQDAAGLPRAAGASPLVYLVAAPSSACGAGSVQLLGRRALGAGLGGLVGGRGHALARPPTAPTSAARTNNSELNLIFGYNGFGRLTGNETGSVGGRRVGGSMWGPTGCAGCSTTPLGGQISLAAPGGAHPLRRACSG